MWCDAIKTREVALTFIGHVADHPTNVSIFDHFLGPRGFFK
jgi:hypothetical protein